MFRRFLESYIDICNNIVTESANSVLMFEAGEHAALDIKTSRIEDIEKEFEKAGLTVSVEQSGKKILFHVKGLVFSGKKCKYCDILRGFFGGIARKHVDPKYFCRKGMDCVFFDGGEKCTFVAELCE